MFQIGICTKNQEQRERMRAELEKWMVKVHIYAKINTYVSAEQMMYQTIERTYPDLFIFDLVDLQTKELEELYKFRKYAPQTIFVSLGTLQGNDLKKHIDLKIFCSLSNAIQTEEICAVATNAYRQYLTDDNSYVFYSRPKFVKIPIKKIIYFSSDKRKVRLYCTDGIYEFYKKLDMVEEEIASKTNQFVRLHKSYLVNQDYIKTCSAHEIKMKNGETLGVSKYYKKDAKQLLKTLNL